MARIMPRKKVYKNNAEKQRVFRKHHLKPVVISRKEYEEKKQKSIAAWARDYDVVEEQVVKSYPAYVKFWLEHFNIDVRLLGDQKYCEGKNITDILVREIECGDSNSGNLYIPSFGGPHNPYLGYGLAVSGMYLILEETENIECPFCKISFCFLEDSCPKCKRQVKIVEEVENKTRAEKVFEERRWDF
jgi:hypothetical protein